MQYMLDDDGRFNPSESFGVCVDGKIGSADRLRRPHPGHTRAVRFDEQGLSDHRAVPYPEPERRRRTNSERDRGKLRCARIQLRTLCSITWIFWLQGPSEVVSK